MSADCSILRKAQLQMLEKNVWWRNKLHTIDQTVLAWYMHNSVPRAPHRCELKHCK